MWRRSIPFPLQLAQKNHYTLTSLNPNKTVTSFSNNVPHKQHPGRDPPHTLLTPRPRRHVRLRIHPCPWGLPEGPPIPTLIRRPLHFHRLRSRPRRHSLPHQCRALPLLHRHLLCHRCLLLLHRSLTIRHQKQCARPHRGVRSRGFLAVAKALCHWWPELGWSQELLGEEASLSQPRWGRSQTVFYHAGWLPVSTFQGKLKFSMFNKFFPCRLTNFIFHIFNIRVYDIWFAVTFTITNLCI